MEHTIFFMHQTAAPIFSKGPGPWKYDGRTVSSLAAYLAPSIYRTLIAEFLEASIQLRKPSHCQMHSCCRNCNKSH